MSMASFHCEIKSGRNGYEHSNYIARKGFHAKRGDLVASGQGNLPGWAGGDAAKVFKDGEKYERINGSVYREVIIALPAELTLEQNEVLTGDLISKLAADKPHQFAIHAPRSSLEGRIIPHLHLMSSGRVDDGIERAPEQFFSRYNAKNPEKGGRRKDSGGRNRIDIRANLNATRALVAETINHHLAINGHEARVDHRTLKARGITREAERYLGVAKIRKMSPDEKASYVAVRRNGRKKSN